jgi:NADPH-dependent curcumin reductase CurA
VLIRKLSWRASLSSSRASAPVGLAKEGDTVVVSAAAGATESVAGQIAKIAGARAVGIAGGPEKCRAVVEEFGFDACIDYREGGLPAALKRHCPRGVDVYFCAASSPATSAASTRGRPTT